MKSIGDNDFLEGYLWGVHRGAISRRDERELLSRARSGDSLALDSLIQNYLELTALITLKLVREGFPMRTAIQESNAVLTNLLQDSSVEEPVLLLADMIHRALQRIDRQPSAPPSPERE